MVGCFVLNGTNHLPELSLPLNGQLPIGGSAGVCTVILSDCRSGKL